MNAGVFWCTGACGSGKTYTLRKRLGHTLRTTRWSALVLDANGEFCEPRDDAMTGPTFARTTAVATVGDARAALRDGRRLVALDVRKVAVDYKLANPFAPVADELANVAIERGGIVLVVPEAHWSMRESYPLPPALGRIVHQWRHLGVCLWADTQNPADVKKEALAAANYLYIHRSAPRDLPQFRNVGGVELVEAVRRLGALADGTGQAGWHIRYNVPRGEVPAYAHRVEGVHVRYAHLESGRVCDPRSSRSLPGP